MTIARLLILLGLVAGVSAYATSHKIHHIGLFGKSASSHKKSHHSLEETHWLTDQANVDYAIRHTNDIFQKSNGHREDFFRDCFPVSLAQDIYSKHVRPFVNPSPGLMIWLGRKEPSVAEGYQRLSEETNGLYSMDSMALNLGLFDTKEAFNLALSLAETRCQLGADLKDMGEAHGLPTIERGDEMDTKQIEKDLARESNLQLNGDPQEVGTFEAWKEIAQSSTRTILDQRTDSTGPTDAKDVWFLLWAFHRTFGDDAAVNTRDVLISLGYIPFPFAELAGNRLDVHPTVCKIVVHQSFYILNREGGDFMPFKITAQTSTLISPNNNNNGLVMDKRFAEVKITFLTNEERAFVNERAEDAR